MIFKYFKRLFSKWLSKFSVITGICGFVAFYSGYDPSNMVAKFIINNLLYVSLLFLIISSYQVWLEVQQELDKIKKNLVDYKITAKIQKIEINLENIKENYKKQLNEIESDIKDCSSQINSLENPNDSPLHKLAGIGISNFSNIMFQIMPNSKSKDEYTTNLKEYKKELESYNSKVENNLKAWESFVNNDLRNIYVVDFSIENTGVKSDKNIDIEIELGKNSYIKNESLEDLYCCYPKVPKKPEKPSRIIAHDNFITSNKKCFSSQSPTLPPIYIKDAFYKSKNFEEKVLSINLREMHVGDDIPIFKESVLLDLIKKEEIKVVIKSESSNKKIEKTVEFEIIEEPIEYYDYWVRQLEE